MYRLIYGYPQLCIASMLYRAVELAFTEDQLHESFFRMDDYQALNFLRTCNTGTRVLVERLLRWQWYEEIFSHEMILPSKQVQAAADHWQGRKQLADAICGRFRIAPEDVCVFITKGRERRHLELPFIYGAKKRFDQGSSWRIYHVNVYTPSALVSSLGKKIAAFVADAVQF